MRLRTLAEAELLQVMRSLVVAIVQTSREPGYWKSVTVHGPSGDRSIFRPKGSIRAKDESRKHRPVPLPADGDSPIFAAKDGSPQPIPPPPRKLGQSPVNGYRNRLSIGDLRPSAYEA